MTEIEQARYQQTGIDTTEDGRSVRQPSNGGPAKTVPYRCEPRYGTEELQELKEALEQGTLFYAQGKKVRALEEAFAAASGVRFAVACTSGTAAIHAALIAHGIRPGDEVITSPITDIGTVVPILYQGAVPVFADLDPHRYTLDPGSVEASITPRTRAVLAVHLCGNACDLESLHAICEQRGIALIEDCAQALGCTYRGRPIGSIGSVGCFSLNEFKHISCGDGGIAITDDEELAHRLRLATDKCYNREPGAAMRNPVFLANNYRMSELQGAVALAQLRKLDDIVRRRRDWCAALSGALHGTPGISLPEVTSGCDPSWWFYLMRVVPGEIHADADTFAAALRAEGVPVGAHYIGQCVYEYPLLAGHAAYGLSDATSAGEVRHPYERREYHHGLCPQAESILETCVSLSINEAYGRQDLEETIAAVRQVARRFQDPVKVGGSPPVQVTGS